MDHYIGRLLDGRYELMEVIGTGGMAIVYKARCHRLNRFVAIKVLKDEYSQDAEFRRRFHAESQAVAMLSHPNIVNVYDVSHSDNVDYIVMELIDGITLKQYVEKKGILNWREVLHFSTQIAKALEHAHSRGIIHRDIKPHNIMILKDGSVKVADFGIARVSSAQSTLTREALGSVHYISPEQAKGSKIDYRSDLYSLGVVMYEMLAGRPPYDGETPVAVAIQHINANAVSPREYNDQIPVGLEQITMHAMTADLDARYESATEMLYDLDEFRKNPARTFLFSDDPVYTTELHQPKNAAERAVRRTDTSRQSTTGAHAKKKSNTTAVVAGVIVVAMLLIALSILAVTLLNDATYQADPVEVPQLVGLHIDIIEQRDYADFEISIVNVNDNSVEKGYVIDQDPAYGATVQKGAKITITVSDGPRTDVMRDVVNKLLQNALNQLSGLQQDLQLKLVEKYEPNEAEYGVVIRTEPAAGETLMERQTIVLYISSGSDENGEVRVPVPALVGKHKDAAIEELDALNLKYGFITVTDDSEEGTVIFQSIPAGEKVIPEETTIQMQISSGPEEDDEPNLPELPGFGSIIYIPMPAGDQTVDVEVWIDGELVDTLPMVELASVSEDGIPITLSGEGTCTVDIHIDGKSWYQFDYNFDTGEVVDQ